MKATQQYINELSTELKRVLSSCTTRVDEDGAITIGNCNTGEESTTPKEWVSTYAKYGYSERRAIFDLFNRANGRHNDFKFSKWMYDELKGNDDNIETAIKRSLELI